MANSEINLLNLNGSNGFILNGIDGGDFSGYSVSSAGDVNGDGIDDLIIGARDADLYGNNSAGESYVVFGSNSGFSRTFDLSSLNGSNGFIINGIGEQDRFGRSVSSAGDVNGDGIDDLIIGAYRADSNGNYDAGASYVVFGSISGFSSNLNLSSLNGSNGFIINGIDAGDRSGRSVSSAGDINGDGIDDLIIGASQADPNGKYIGGESYVVFGSISGFSSNLNLSSLNGNNGFIINGIDERDSSGFSVSGAGDINGDGIDDIIIGAYRADPNGTRDAGESYVVFGSNSGFNKNLDLSSLNGSNGFIINGINEGEWSGFSVSDAGDVNGDGIDDLVIGAYRADPNDNTFAGESYVVFGSDSGFSRTFDLSSLNGSNGFIINGIDEQDRFGRSVRSAGDVNGDGIDDLIIGARNADPNGNDSAGESYVVFGRSNGFSSRLDLSSLNGSNGFTINGIDEQDLSGHSVSSAGDVNGDGIDDLIIGAFAADSNGNNSSGESYVVFGNKAPELDLNEVSIGLTIKGIDAFDYSGWSLSDAGDINGDGFDDIIIGTRFASVNGNAAGQSYVVFGKEDFSLDNLELFSLDGTNGFTINGIDGNDQAGFSVSKAGDINGDGIDDLVIGASRANPNGTLYAGESYVVFGKSGVFNSSLELSDLNGNNGFTINGVDKFDRSGYSVSNAGDINGDGIDDLIIGAVFGDINGINSGESYVVFGSIEPFNSSFELSDLDGTNGFIINGIDAQDRSGFSVSGAGDINGDGLDDLIIGAPYANPTSTYYGGTYSGETYVVYGSALPFNSILNLSTLTGNDGFVLKGTNELDRSGYVVNHAGDINNDGIGDFIVGTSNLLDNVPGEAYVVFGSQSPFESSFELQRLDGSNGFVINGINISDQAGSAVSSVGDVNGDGIDDLLIGAKGSDPSGNLSGESYVIFGSSSPFSRNLDLSSLNGSKGFKISGVNETDQAGFAVSGAGDVNNDGYHDLIIGAPFANPNGNDRSGESYVIFGRSNLGAGGVINLSQIGGLDNIDGIDFKTEFKGTPVVIVASNLNVVDDNSSSLVGATITLKNPIDGSAEQLSANTTGTNIVATYNSSTGTLALSGIDSLTNYQQVLRTVTYANSAPTGTERIIEFIVDDGEAHSNTSAVATTTLSFDLNQPPVAVADSFTIDEDIPISGNVLADNGNGVDSDPNGDPITVTALNGVGSDVGSLVTLTSGAQLTLNSDGTFDYDPNGQFESLATGILATDRFEYTISDGNGETDTAIVTISINGVNDSPTVDVAITDLTTDAYSSFSFDVPTTTFDDVDRDDLALSATLDDGSPLPDWLQFDPSTNTFSGFPTNSDVTSLSIQVTADDGNGGTITDTFELRIDLPLNSTTNTINGNRFGNFLIGTSTNDLINGRGGSDLLLGLNGNDNLFGQNGADILRGGRGNDVLDGGRGSDRLIGNAGADLLVGGNGFDVLLGGNDNDTLDGGNRADLLNGGNGNDVLIGGKGSDDLFGGRGSDLFVLAPGQGNDFIRDYQDGDDTFGLTDGLIFDDLTITNNVFGNAVVRLNDSTLATVLGVNANALGDEDFHVL